MVISCIAHVSFFVFPHHNTDWKLLSPFFFFFCIVRCFRAKYKVGILIERVNVMAFLWGSIRWIVAITIVCWAVFIISMVIDRRRYQNAIYLSASVLSLLILLGSVCGKALSSICLIILFLILATVPKVLVEGGLRGNSRGQKKTAGNYLAIVIGAVILLVEVAALLFFLTAKVGFELYKLSTVLVFLGVTIFYLSLLLLAFMLFSWALGKLPKKNDFDYLIVNGDHLLPDGSLSDGQKRILNKAIEVYRADPTPPVVIASGGRMDGDPVAEGEIMSMYLREHDIPQENIRTELLSTNDKQNVEYSKRIIDDAGGGRYIAFITDCYSVYRNASYSKKLGMDVVGIGATVRKEDRAIAILREFAAFHAEPKRLSLAVAGWAVTAVVVLLVLL